MNTIRTVLVTTDFSDTSKSAFALAGQVAEKFEAKVVAFHVQELQFHPLVVEYVAVGLPEIERRHEEQAREKLEDVAQQLGTEVETVVASGTPHLEIVRMAEERGVDLIVMATHGRGFFSHAVLGSTTERVIRRAPCPVLVVRDPVKREPPSGE
jgi:nucleotide-binding universal stress UspA family protein